MRGNDQLYLNSTNRLFYRSEAAPKISAEAETKHDQKLMSGK